LRRITRFVVPALVVALASGLFTIGASAVLAPEIDQAAATFSVTSPPSAPTQCTGLDSATYATVNSTATGTSTESSSGGRFPLDGNVTLKLKQTVKVNLAGLSDAVATGTILMTYPADPKHRLSGKFTALAQVNLGDNSSAGRGFISANYQKKTATGFVNTGDVLYANTEFATPAHLSTAASTTSGSIGGATGATPNLALKVFKSC
jgi:hypothetical protein